jgi:hypothetical protein
MGRRLSSLPLLTKPLPLLFFLSFLFFPGIWHGAQAIVRPLGLSLGLGLLTLGRLLYNPCLFYLPAVLAVKKKKK